MKNHTLLYLLLLAVLTLTACHDDLNEGVGGETPLTPFEGGNVTLTLRLPDYEQTSVMRAMQDDAIATNSDNKYMLSVIAFKGQNTDTGKEKLKEFDPSDITLSPTGASGEYKATINLPKGTTFIEVVANADISSAEKSMSATTATDYSDASNTNTYPVGWGCALVSSLLSNDYTISLIRQRAKICYEVALDVKDFSVEEMTLIHAANCGTVAPSYSNLDNAMIATSATSPSEVTYDNVITGTSSIYAYEQPAEVANGSDKTRPRVIFKAKYNGKEYYYPVDFLVDKDKTKDYIPLLRNHKYTISISSVNAEGYASLDDAKTAPAENRLTYDVIDNTPAIVNMIACKDYHLGVCDTLTANWNSGTVMATVVSTNKYASFACTASTSDNWITLSTDQASFKKGDTATGITITDVPSDGTEGSLFNLTITIGDNGSSDQPRTGTITVTSGDLTREIVIVQKGRDFKREDANRKVQLWSNTTELASDYFNDFIDNSSQTASGVIGYGVTTEQMGAERNQGLHFTFGTNTWYYLIPKKQGDETPVKSADGYQDYYTVTEDGSNWKVELASGHVTDLWVSKGFSIKNNGVSVAFPVYHTGIFHNINSHTHEMGTAVKDGWYYYEVVKVKGTKYTYFVLDRNLGATSNKFYTQATVDFRENAGSIGAYYEPFYKESNSSFGQYSGITPTGYTAKTDDMSSAEEFKIITLAQVQDMPLSVAKRYTTNGETYNVPVITTTGDSQLKEIIIPRGGYMEGNDLQNPNQAELWTSTLLAGNQGFDTSSPEYALWYYYIDVNVSRAASNTMRFVDGSAGDQGSLKRGMPLRLVIGSAPAEEISFRKNDFTVTTSYTLTIYYINSKEWPYVYTYSNESFGNWKGFNYVDKADQGTQNINNTTVTVTSEGNSRYKIEEKWTNSSLTPSMIIFNNGSGNQSTDLSLGDFSLIEETVDENAKTMDRKYSLTAYFEGKNKIDKTTYDNYVAPTKTVYTPTLTSSSEYCVFLKIPASISWTPYAYIWNESGGDSDYKAWPGTQMDFMGYSDNTYQYKIYKFTYSQLSGKENIAYLKKIIFNNNGIQTADIGGQPNQIIRHYFEWNGQNQETSSYSQTDLGVITNVASSGAKRTGMLKLGRAYWQSQPTTTTSGDVFHPFK